MYEDRTDVQVLVLEFIFKYRHQDKQVTLIE